MGSYFYQDDSEDSILFIRCLCLTFLFRNNYNCSISLTSNPVHCAMTDREIPLAFIYLEMPKFNKKYDRYEVEKPESVSGLAKHHYHS